MTIPRSLGYYKSAAHATINYLLKSCCAVIHPFRLSSTAIQLVSRSCHSLPASYPYHLGV